MERVSETTIKPEREDSVSASTEYEGKGTHSIENSPGNIIYIKDFLHIKDEPEEMSDCIKKEIKDGMEVGFEEWEESEAGGREYLSRCVEGNITEVGQISSARIGMPEVFQKIKLETQDDAELNDVVLEAGLDAAEGKNLKPEEDEWCQVESSHTPSSVETKYEGILRKKFDFVKDPLAIRLGRLNPDVPDQWINSEGKLEDINKDSTMLDPTTKSLPQGPNIFEDPGSHVNNKGGSTEVKENFAVRDVCDHLSANTFEKSNMTQHSQVNSKERQFSYNDCSYVNSSKDGLNICITQNKEKMFACDQCSFRTNKKPYLKQHHLVHRKEKMFACDQCSYMTNIKGNLTKHHLNHSSLKKFACDQCSYTTNIKGNLTKHYLVHSNFKNFACDQCSYTTNIKGNLTKHCLIHSNFKKFACGQCSYKTNDRSHLTRHCLTHEIF